MLSTIIGLAALGTLLLLAEVILPGGILGVLGFVLLVIATYYTSEHYGSVAAMSLFFGVVGTTILAFILFFRSPASSLIVLKSSLEKEPLVDLNHLIGRRGTTTTELRPSGKASFAWEGSERVLDVVTNDGFIERNREVMIEKIEGPRIVVRALT